MTEVQDMEKVPGYISIKDYAYDETNALHYGYLEEEESGETADVEGREDGEDEDSRRASVVLPQDYVINQKAVALYDFEPENDNELGLTEGDVVFISYRHGQGWLVAQNEEQTKTGLVPEEFVSYLEGEEDDEQDSVRPFYLTQMLTQGFNAADESAKVDVDAPAAAIDEEDEWEDIDQLETDLDNKLNISVS
ncbi:NAP1-binding protein 2 [Nakaseomyces bracarensis]|uniref:NAP1-binding protein 2 n=1 Tax=Nakaseomyces bracarensis TaxID=273131 RepID=A0ABR4NT79_9SACH